MNSSQPLLVVQAGVKFGVKNNQRNGPPEI